MTLPNGWLKKAFENKDLRQPDLELSQLCRSQLKAEAPRDHSELSRQLPRSGGSNADTPQRLMHTSRTVAIKIDICACNSVLGKRYGRWMRQAHFVCHSPRNCSLTEKLRIMAAVSQSR